MRESPLSTTFLRKFIPSGFLFLFSLGLVVYYMISSQTYAKSLLLAALSIVTALFLDLFSIYNLKSSLEALVKMAGKLGYGDMTVRVEVTSNDEIGLMQASINRMAESLQNTILRLQKGVIQLTSSSTEISATVQEQENDIMALELSSKEIAAAAKEIYATAKDLAATMAQVNKTAEDTSKLASSGKEGINQMSAIMQQMVEASNTIALKLGVLADKAGNITSVITTITKVADQTNLLSLNAAIEAEKAGEHGASFAVIAREIRRLADQVAYATLDIKKMITEMGTAVSSGVMGVDKFTQEIRTGVNQVGAVGEQLAKIISQVQEQTNGIEIVNQGMQSQAQAAEQISSAISQMSRYSQSTNRFVHMFQQTTEALNKVTKEVQDSISKIVVK